MFQKIGILSSIYSIILSNIMATMPITIWLMKHYFLKISCDCEESAKIEGASIINIWWNIILPQVKKGFMVTFCIIFILIWNEYVFSLFFYTNKTQNLTILLASSSGLSKSVLIIIMVLPIMLLSFITIKLINNK